MTIQEMHNLFRISLDKMDNNSLPYFEPETIDLILNYCIYNVVKQKISGNNALKRGAEEGTKRKEDLQPLINEYICHSISFNPGKKPYGYLVPLPSDLLYILDEEVCISSDTCSPEIKSGEIQYGGTYKVSSGEIDYNSNSYQSSTSSNIFTGEKGITTFSEISTPVKVILCRRINVLPIRNDQYNTLILDPFNRPDENKVLKIDYGIVSSKKNVELISSQKINVDKYYLRYYKNPVKVDIVNGVDCDLPDMVHQEIVDYAVNWTLESIESPRFQTQIANIQRNE